MVHVASFQALRQRQDWTRPGGAIPSPAIPFVLPSAAIPLVLPSAAIPWSWKSKKYFRPKFLTQLPFNYRPSFSFFTNIPVFNPSIVELLMTDQLCKNYKMLDERCTFIHFLKSKAL